MDVLSDAIAAMRTGRPHSSRTRFQAPWGLRFPPTEGAGFHVVLQGACWLLPPDGEPLALGPGDVVFLRKGGGHGLADDPATPLVDFRPDRADAEDPDRGRASAVVLCGAYRLDRARPHPVLNDLADVVHLPARVGRHPSLRMAVDLLGSELERPRPGADAIVPALLDMLLLYILRAWYEDRSGEPGASGWAAAFNDPSVMAALRCVHLDPARQWTVAELAAAAGLSRAAFARRFAAAVGEPPLAYVTRWRMTTAARLLRQEDAPLAEVARRTGYTSEFAFAKAFKREFGTAPGRYRREAVSVGAVQR
ncbi:AraC family transcriptional regulator [Allonocardiopsis opalescens]|uniref:AraC-like DNA-binding protein n=1 Tax=Allonocardiopsis opalescens TaxID=1144618 RepID=A0A2T0PYN1_9ACTN|nr:AraC family transcriptional regulator [Allonocardiopsis opalescens]PRX96651.1 AraC-like DNA-binding protein [Allonocardiopsis opalescens]